MKTRPQTRPTSLRQSPVRRDGVKGGFCFRFLKRFSGGARGPLVAAVFHGLASTALADYVTGFEEAKAAPIREIQIGSAIWSAAPGHAEITARFAHRGKQCLHLQGGERRAVTLRLEEEIEPGMRLRFQAERWTKRAPYAFRIEAEVDGEWREIYRGDDEIRVGRSFLSAVQCPLPASSRTLRFVSTAPEASGTLIDDILIDKPAPMEVTHVGVEQRVIPALIGKKDNPVTEFMIRTRGSASAVSLHRVTIRTDGTTDLKDVASFSLFHVDRPFGEPSSPAKEITFTGALKLGEGEHRFRVSCALRPDADWNHRVDAQLVRLEFDDGTVHTLGADATRLTGPQRIGVAVRTAGQDGCHTYRIPGLATTTRGTLIAVYDNRYRGSGDLPNDIDVGMSRSTDGGRTWEPMKVIMDMGADAEWRHDGIGDPCILVDRGSGRIWVAATWSHGDRSWHGSGPGLEPEETGQLMLTYSDDDGLTWSPPRNITKQIKKPEWRFVLQGPGKGITMSDGTLVFPAQFRGENAEPVEGKPFSTLIYSRDHGESWRIGSGVKIDTTEAQLVELSDGSIMINCRDNRNRGLPDGQNGRTVAVTKDMGATWALHPTDRRALPEPTCMASLIRMEHGVHGPLLFFSNPASGQDRFNMTLKVSRDEGMTWPERWHTLYDARQGAGYSCLTVVDEDHVGVLYEGVRDLYFLRFSVEELLRGPAWPTP